MLVIMSSNHLLDMKLQINQIVIHERKTKLSRYISSIESLPGKGDEWIMRR